MTLARLNQLAMQLDSKQAKTSFGKLPLSHETTAPNYGFSHQSKALEAKKFIGALTVQENMGKGSPGPQYQYEDRIKFKASQEFAFTQEAKLP